uniref:nuclear speckle splicing regulatory protein 1-like n=1 Tax=Myxine glutinosa TaxID=7769 RepID=UPI00358EBB36
MAASGRKQYGLIQPRPTRPNRLLSRPSIFQDSDDDETVGEVLQKEGEKKAASQKTILEMQRALATDSTVFEYDSVYDDMQAERHSKVTSASKQRQPRYIQGLLAAAETRKKNDQRREERKAQKEREAEGDRGEEMAFVTGAYRQRMEERQKEDDEERRENERDAVMDVTKQKDLNKFYRSLLDLGEKDGEELGKISSLKKEVKIEQESHEDDKDMGVRESTKRVNHGVDLMLAGNRHERRTQEVERSDIGPRDGETARGDKSSAEKSREDIPWGGRERQHYSRSGRGRDEDRKSKQSREELRVEKRNFDTHEYFTKKRRDGKEQTVEEESEERIKGKFVTANKGGVKEDNEKEGASKRLNKERHIRSKTKEENKMRTIKREENICDERGKSDTEQRTRQEKLEKSAGCVQTERSIEEVNDRDSKSVEDTIEAVNQPGEKTIEAVSQPGEKTIEAVSQPGEKTIEAVSQPGEKTIEAESQPVEKTIEAVSKLKKRNTDSDVAEARARYQARRSAQNAGNIG